jgi:formate hydrogenlyase subunit 4
MIGVDAILVLLQLALLVAAAPLLQGVVKKTKAVLQGRRGPPVVQPYRDLAKLWRKEVVASKIASPATLFGPWVILAATLGAAACVPVVAPRPLAASGDALVFLGLLGLARFALVLIGLDQGGAFGGMGASREASFGVVLEPALVLFVAALVALTGRAGLGEAASILEHEYRGYPVIAGIFLGLAGAMLLIAETGRIPVDNPDTHLELTMVHEGCVLELSGPLLGAVTLAYFVKQAALALLFLNVLVPFGLATSIGELPLAIAILPVKLGAAAAFLAITETLLAKMRLFKAADLLMSASAYSFIAVFFALLGRMSRS